MIKHIVMWKLKDENKADNALTIKNRLESLVGKIEGLISANVGINTGADKDSFDAVLESTFTSMQALAEYKVHPLHVEVSTFVKSVRTDRKSVDYEI